jgi:hypothetical protein
MKKNGFIEGVSLSSIQVVLREMILKDDGPKLSGRMGFASRGNCIYSPPSIRHASTPDI